MAFLDNTGLQHLISSIKSKLDAKSDKTHTHDDRYFTKSEMNTKLGNKVDKTQAGVTAAINLLSTGTSDPTDNDYYISQYAGGGTSTTTYHRRPVSALYNYMKSKFDSVYQAKGSYAASSHTHNYAGSSSAGGSANSAVKLDTATAGSVARPVYFSGGKPVQIDYTIEKSVPSNAVFTDTKNTSGSTDTSSKIFLVGATSQAANPQTYSDNEVYVTSGVLTTKKVQVGGQAATMEYDSTNQCINFVFN